MLILRLYLLSGLVIHKLVWEILRRKQSSSTAVQDPPVKISVRLIKFIKVAILLGVVTQTFLPDVLPISDQPFVLRLAGSIIYTAGLVIAISGRTQLGTNWSNIETAHVLNKQSVISEGPYRFIRHPIYVGDLLLLLGLELALNSMLVFGVLLLIPLVLRQAVKEEKKLLRALPGYRDYCAQTKRFIPFVV
jgi:protein-S-isoprenylcysteine O-methyltransferase Ste14